MNAIDNISATRNAPVYLSTGELVTTSTTSTGMWSGGLLHYIDRDLSGNSIFATLWTGTSQSGVAEKFLGGGHRGPHDVCDQRGL